ncbi:MAG: hypothetical protein ACFFGZ_00630 [Candidatus Thorarchaeota archaeon]
MLSKNQFAEAKQYIENNARLLDKALFRFEFHHGSPQAVIDILKTYQNKDGGFGKGLEPDLRITESSVLATTVALQYMNELSLSEPNTMIERAITYLVSEIQQFPEDSYIKYYWYPAPIELNQTPRAPWWSVEKYEPPEIEEWPNPSVEVISYLLRYSQFVPHSLLIELLADLQSYLKLVPELTGFIYYKFLCFKRLMPHVSQEILKDIFAMLDRTFENTELLDERKFEEIKIQWFITEKSSYLFQKYPEKITKLIENEVKRMGDDGGSHPQWRWGKDELWKQVEKEWAGKCTHELLATLKNCRLINI